MPPRLSTPRRIVVLMLSSLVVLMATATPAMAAEAPELTFPQDALVTTFHDTWGAARSEGRTHKGTDLMAPKLTPVYAVADGVVTHIADGPRSGRWIAIDHGDGWESWYMHLNNDHVGTDDGDAPWAHTIMLGIEEGTEVFAGQRIGWVGDSGNAEPSSPHTHFELHHNGVAVDPYRYLADAYRRALADVAVGAIPAVADFIREVGSTPLRPVRILE